MNILAFIYEYPPLGGGGGVVFKNIVEELRKRHAVTVVTSLFRGLERHESSHNLEIYRVPVWHRTSLSTASLTSLISYWPTSLRLGTRLLDKQQFDIINSHFAVPSGPSAQQLARRFHIPHVLTLHGGDIYDPSKSTSPHRVPLLKGVVRRLLVGADRVVAQSSDTADNARTLYKVDRQIEVIPLGIPRGPVTSSNRSSLGIRDDQFVIVTVGRLVARKAVDDLIQVAKDLNDERDLLIVVGDGPKKQELEALASRLGIANRIRFTGFVTEEDKRALLAASDIFASTSLHEGFGLMFLEAMEQGLPIVAYDHGGQTDFLVDGRSGRLVPAGDHRAFVDAIRELKATPEARGACSQFNRNLVNDFFVDRCAERYEHLFLEVAGHRSKRS